MSEDKVELLSTPYGEVAYESFRELGFAFADKSSVIKELERKNTPRYPVLLRPRRFGKSTFVQMLKCFYVYTANLSSHNTYHVIDFDFSGVSGEDKDTLVDSFIIAVKRGITNFLSRYPDFVFTPAEAEKKTPSGFIRSFFDAYDLYHAKKSLYLMVDEYDNFANSILSQDLELFKSITLYYRSVIRIP